MFTAHRHDDGTWYVNGYFRDGAGELRRETLVDNLTEDKANDFVEICESYRPFMTGPLEMFNQEETPNA